MCVYILVTINVFSGTTYFIYSLSTHKDNIYGHDHLIEQFDIFQLKPQV